MADRGAVSHLLTSLRWQVEKRLVSMEGVRVEQILHRLGMERPVAPAPEASTLVDPQEPMRQARSLPVRTAHRRVPLVAATVCTRSHLHQARTLARSLRRHEPELPLIVYVIDGEEVDRLAVPHADVVLREQVETRVDYRLLKFDAFQACATAKPALIQDLFRSGVETVVYLDTDIHVFAPLRTLLDALRSSDMVVTPHLRRPLRPRAWERPTNRDITEAGILNSGLFAIRNGSQTRTFLQVWRDLMDEPSAFLSGRTAPVEQGAFAWCLTMVESCRVLNTPNVNVAYWNLHERGLRSVDDGPVAAWEVEGLPLETFHFSGFDPASPTRLSRWDGRHPTWSHGALAELLSYYARELESSSLMVPRADYRFDAFPSGVPIDDRMRRIFKSHERQLWQPLDPFSAEGELHYCRALLVPCPTGRTLLPLLLQELWFERAELRSSFPDADIDPSGMITWFARHGCEEMGYGLLFDRHRPTFLSLEGLLDWQRVLKAVPRVFEGFESPLRQNRRAVLGRLEAAGLGSFAEQATELRQELWEVSPIWAVRRLHEAREDLQSLYPDPLYADADEFQAWLKECGCAAEKVPSELVSAFSRTSRGRSLVRLYSFLSRDWERARWAPAALCGDGYRTLLRSLLEVLDHEPEFDLDDLVMFQWIAETQPYRGLEFALALVRLFPDVHSSGPGQAAEEKALAGVLAGSEAARRELARVRAEEARRGRGGPPTRRSPAQPGSVHELPAPDRQPRRVAGGVNCFGYFHSPIGLGSMSQGLLRVLEASGTETAAVTLTTHAMDDELEADDLLYGFEERFGTNLFVSYPHLEIDHLTSQPRERVRNRRNIAYLAWELPEANPAWSRVYDGYEQVWALSSFAARSLASALRRDVATVPCSVDPAALPARVSKRSLGLPEGRHVVLAMMDASSSLERKNPEAVIDAFATAFRPDDPVELVLRVANGWRRDHRPHLRALEERARATGLRVRFVVDRLKREKALALISCSDCYISLHRAEGFGMTCAEAMAYARPVVATGATGNLDYMDETSALLVPARESSVETPEGPFRRGMGWFEPDVETAAIHLRRVFEEPSFARSLGRRARRQVERTLAPQVLAQEVRRLLGQEPTAVRTPPVGEIGLGIELRQPVHRS